MNASNKKWPIPEKTNLALGMIFILIDIAYFFIAPVLAKENSFWWLMLLPAILTTNSQWVLTHEAVHSIFHRNQTINAWFGRLIGLGLGINFHVARFGHLMHHRFNRQGLDLLEGYKPKQHKKWLVNVRYYSQICLGIYLSGILAPLLFFLPKAALSSLSKKALKDPPGYFNLFESILLKAKTLSKVRINTFVLLLIWMSSFYLYGHFWWILLTTALLRGFMLSFADNLPHYGTTTQDVLFAYNLTLPRFLQKWMLNFNLHRIHHHYPLIPWQFLPQKFVELNEHFDIGYFKQGMRQWRGVVPLAALEQSHDMPHENQP